MKYYPSDTPLRLREYGRNIQMMVDIMQEESSVKNRERMAHEIIRIMSTLVPNSKELVDYKKKLWDHLHRLAHYQLDIPTPHPPQKPPEQRNNGRISYYPYTTRYRQYGKNVELMIEQASQMPPSEQRSRLIVQIVNIMKQFLNQYGTTTTNDQTILEQLGTLSRGNIQLTLDQFNRMQHQVGPPTPPPKSPSAHPHAHRDSEGSGRKHRRDSKKDKRHHKKHKNKSRQGSH